MPAISAGALKRMLDLPANVVTGAPRIEKGRIGGDLVIGTVRPYARDLGRCAGCGEHGRPYDRLGMRRWRHLDMGCAKLLLEYAPPRVDCGAHGVTVVMVPWARRKSAYTYDFERQTAWLSVHAPRSAVSALMRVDWKSVGPVRRRVADDLRAEQSAGLFDDLRSIGVDETSYRKGHKYMTVVVDHDRGRVIWMRQGHGGRPSTCSSNSSRPPSANPSGSSPATGRGGSTSARSAGAPWPNASSTGSTSSAGRPTRSTRSTPPHGTRPGGEASPEKGAKDPVKGARWALLKNEADLTAGQKAQLECVANADGILWQAYKLKERLRMILRQTAGEAAPLLRQWAADAFLSGIGEFPKPGEKTDRRHFDILRTIRSGLSNARLEAVNNRIKTTIRIGYGYRNLDNLIALVMLKCGGLNLQLPERQ